MALLLQRDPADWKALRAWGRLLLAGLPFAAGIGVLVVLAQLKHSGIQTTALEKGRSWAEVELCSPYRNGLLDWQSYGHENSIYVGILTLTLLGAGLLAQLVLAARRPREHWRNGLFLVAVLGIAAAVVTLALGTRGPHHGSWLRHVRDWIPPYAFIRQPTKALTVFPILLALALTLACNALLALRDVRWLRRAIVPALLALPILLDYKLQVRPTVCLLDREQPAYLAVAADAARHDNMKPRVIVLPIWPGESSWASLYEHYVSLYRVRMINGYQPVIPREYIRDVFEPFESLNCGILTEDQLDKLKQKGIGYILLHEDAFPEKVSHFPVAFTLKRLLEHPRLELLEHGENVWAFRIVAEPVAKPAPPADWNVFFPNFHYEVEWAEQTNAVVLKDASASDGQTLRLDREGSEAALPPIEHLAAAEPSLLLRHRGQGTLALTLTCDNGRTNTVAISLTAANWRWTSIPLSHLGESRFVTPCFQRVNGSVDLDLALYCAGHLPEFGPRGELSLPAPLFFHAGHTDLPTNCVVLKPDRDPADRIFYGPKLPLPEGDYELSMIFETDAPSQTPLGHMEVDIQGAKTPPVAVLADQPARLNFSNKGRSLPIEFGFYYSRAAQMKINRVIFTRHASSDEHR
jgi:hypothetical protein